MRAIQIQQTGGPEVLEIHDLPVPQPQAGEVLVRVHTAGVNFIDTYLREGRYPAPLPFIPGQEAAGVVEALGDNVSGFRLGQSVAFSGVRGAYAEFVSVPARELLAVPDRVSMETAAAVLLQGLTAHYLAFTTYPIRSNDTVLIHAGAGGLGLLLTQMAKRMGARVLTTVSTEEKAALSRAAGADRAILYTQESFADAVHAETSGEGLSVVYDSVGKTTFEDSLRCLRPTGLLVLCGASSGAVPPFDLIRLSTMGSLFVTRPTLKDFVRTREALETRAAAVFDMVARGELQVHIGGTYPLAQAAEAHRDLEARKTVGKLLLTV